MTFRPRLGWRLLLTGLGAPRPLSGSAQVLETETARLLPSRHYELNSALEVQTSGEGIERAVPLAIEYGVTRRLSLLAEPVAYTAIRPNRGQRATGAGDLELTGIFLLRPETRGWPALAVAAEAKLPTARNRLIGTGKTDYAGYVIASKRVGALDVHGNVGYALLGRPAGVSLNNIVTGALAVEYHVGTGEVFGEVLGNTSATPEGGAENTTTTATNPATAEVVGGELVGTLGAGLSVGHAMLLTLGVSYDNNQAVLFRPGISYIFP